MADILKISFEFSPKLGVRDLPQLGENHESNIKGMYIVGDLADAPIIKVALRQGHDVAARLAAELGGTGAGEDLDVAIVGAGPAGIGAALALAGAGLRYAVFEREAPFATIQNFPKGKFIFSEPHQIENPSQFWFEDAAKEDLVQRWHAALEEQSLDIRQPVEVIDIQRQGDGFNLTLQAAGAEGTETLRAHRVILAIGKRGQPNRLSIPGEDLPHVHYAMKDAAQHAGERVVVIGGGDSAVETAVSLADAGADVIMSYRGESFHRAKARNQAAIAERAEAGALDLRFNTQAMGITPDTVVLERHSDGTKDTVSADTVFLMIGNRLPLGFLRRLGIRMQGEMDVLRAVWITSFALLTYAFYCLKSKKMLFPFGEGDPLEWMHAALTVDLGFREVSAGFWGTTIFALLILVFGLRAYFKYPSRTQKRRYLSLIGYQWIFLFGVPELIAPLVIERPWKVYALTVPWPLSIWSLIDAPSWANDVTGAAVAWLVLGALVSFVAIPLYVRKHGERFCSYMCGCGGLAETLGDFWRHLAPRGRTAKQAEGMGRVILLLAIPVTLLILNDAWDFVATAAFASTKAFAQHWYGLMVDFWLASIVGVALYPYLGNRVWCRFFCPLRAYMEEIARRFSRIAIQADDRCIGCGECTRYCQMGIPVQTFAQKQVLLSNRNSACIQCGICIEVCPMNVLDICMDADLPPAQAAVTQPPRASWES